MKVIVAGGTGLIGKPFVQLLAERGYQVVVLTRSLPAAGLPTGVEAAGWDGKTPDGWQQQLEEADAVVNLAGENIGNQPWTNERKQKIRASRMDAGQAITAAITSARHKPQVLLQASAIGFYGVHGDEMLNETSAAGHDFLSSVSLDWEASTLPVELLGVRRVVLRTGIYLTPQGGVLARFLYPWNFFLGGPMGSGMQWLSWIHARDQLQAMCFLMENDQASGPYNLAAPEPVTNATFGRVLAAVLHKPFWAPIPAFALRLLLGEMSTLVLDGQRVFPERLVQLGFRFEFDRLEPALHDLLVKK